MRRRTWACLPLAAFLLFTTLTPPAQAAIWPIDISNLSEGPLVTGSNGSVTAFRCEGQSSEPLAKTWNSNGELVNTAMDTSGSCGHGTVGAGHVIYMTSVKPDSLEESTVAVRGNTPLWRKTWVAACNKFFNIRWREVGPDGYLYEMLFDGQCDTSNYFIHKVDPYTGNEVFRKQLNIEWGPYKIMMTRLGVIFLTSNPTPRLHYYDLSGNKQKVLAVDVSLGYNMLGFTDNGRVYIANENHANTSCPDLPIRTTSLSGYDELGKFFEYKFTSCKRVVSIAPTSTGTVVVSMIDQAGTLSLVSFSANGTKRMVELPQTRQDGKWYDSWQSTLIADTNGNVVLRRGTYADKTLSWDSFSETYLLLNGTSLEVLKTTQSDAFSQGVTQVWQLGFAIGPGRLYLALRDPCQAGNTCGRKLYSVPFANVGMDYPRGAVLSKGAKQHLNIVALGDSFSSGEGNEPFIPPSDQNGCHRSSAAYPVLLEKDSSLRFKLQAFRACSGARTWEITQGRNGEPPQVNSITQDTDVVTITISGNDAGFEAYIKACLQPFSGGCAENSAAYSTIVDLVENELPDKLDAALEAIASKLKSKGSFARVLVIGYPFIVREHIVGGACALELSQEEQQAAEDVTMLINSKLTAAVLRIYASNKRFYFVDSLLSSSPFTGHDMCSLDPFFNNWNPGKPQVFTGHPNQKGQKAYAELIRSFWLSIN